MRVYWNSRHVIYLTDSDVSRLVSFTEAATAVENAFLALGRGEASLQQRVRVTASGSKLSMLGAILASEGLAGAKVYTTSPRGGFCFSVLLFRQEDEQWVAVMDGSALTAIRTAATSLVAARHMASPRSEVMTVFGAGAQATAHCLAFAGNFPLRQIRLVHRRPATDLALQLTEATGVPVEQWDDPKEALGGSDLVVTATRATEPLFRGKWIEPRTHITAVGATNAEAREIDDEAVDRCARVVVESVDQARGEAGDLVGAVRRGVFDWSHAIELADVIAERETGQGRPGDLTLFESLGVGLEDVALAGLAYRRAMEVGCGRQL
jgi:ornithine cyclodeaminase